MLIVQEGSYSPGVSRLESLGLRQETRQAFADFVAASEIHAEAQLGRVVRVDRGEGDIAQPLSDLAAAYPDLSFGSYPFQSAEGRFGANVVVRGQDAARVGEAEAALRATFA